MQKVVAAPCLPDLTAQLPPSAHQHFTGTLLLQGLGFQPLAEHRHQGDQLTKASPAQILEDLNVVALSSSRRTTGIAWAPVTGGKESGASEGQGA